MFASTHRSLFFGDSMSLVYHLALVPAVGLLSGGPAIHFIGYLWLLTDAIVDMASSNGAGHDSTWRVRMCVHLPASIWTVGASTRMSGAALFVGIPLGLRLFLHALFGPRLANTRLVQRSFVVPGMIAWLLSIAYSLGAFMRG